jgi:UDP-glucose 4-epimerase
MSERVLVTGGAGFIGSHLVDRLLAEGRRVTVLDDFSSGRRENLATAESQGDLRVIAGSVLDRTALGAAIKGCSRVYHLAVQCVRRSLERPLDNHEINATGTLMALEAARQAGIERFVYCSSSEVYGNCGGERLAEDVACAPVTVYGAAKLAGELYAKAYHQTYGLPIVIVRPFNAYGPREHEQGDLAEVIPRFVIRLLNGLPPIIFGSGGNGRDFTYVTDTVRGIAAAASSDALLGRVVNIAYGRMITIRKLAEAAARRCGRPEIAPQHIAPRPGDVIALQADTLRAREVLGFQAEIDFEDGLGRYIDWFRAHHNDVSALLEDDPCNWRMPMA